MLMQLLNHMTKAVDTKKLNNNTLEVISNDFIFIPMIGEAVILNNKDNTKGIIIKRLFGQS